MTITNSSTYDNAHVFARIGLPAAQTDTTVITPTAAVKNSVPLTQFLRDPDDTSGKSVYFCLKDTLVGAGNLWISLGQAIPVNPPFTAPYRYAEMEFGRPGDTFPNTDVSYVQRFDFPVNIATYSSQGSQLQASNFRQNTCQIVNSMRDALKASNLSADQIAKVVRTENGNFTQILSPATSPENWPSMKDYLGAFSGKTLTVEGQSGAGKGSWYTYSATIAGDTLKLTGKIGQDAEGGQLSGGHDGATMSVSVAALENTGIFKQDDEFTVDGHSPAGGDVVYRKIWNDVTSAFDYGYWGTSYGAGLTGLDTKEFWIDWTNPTFGSPSKGQPAYREKTGFGTAPYNIYAKVLSEATYDYLFPYNENFGKGGLNMPPLPQLTPPPKGGQLRIGIQSDGWVDGSGSTKCTASP